MNDSVLPISADTGPGQDTLVQPSGGGMLRSAREAQGLHIAALAVSLKVPVKKLEALEADRFDLLPDIVFVRALACSVCRALKIDPDPILASLPHGTAPRLKTRESGINVPFRVSQDGVGLSLRAQLSKPAVLAVLVLLIGVAVLVFFPFEPRTEVAEVTRSEPASVIFPPSTPAPLASDNQVPEVVAPGQASSGDVSGSDGLPVGNPGQVAPPVSLPVPGADAVPLTVAGSGATTGLVVFKALGPCWVEVVDASRTVQVRKTLITGEVVGASGVLPLSVVVGRADAAAVQVRGEPFDLTRFAKDNVARFEVK